MFTVHWTLITLFRYSLNKENAWCSVSNFVFLFPPNTDHNSYVFAVHWTLIALFNQSVNARNARSSFSNFPFFFPWTLNTIIMCSQFTVHILICAGSLWEQQTQDAQFQILSFSFSLNTDHNSYVFTVHWSLYSGSLWTQGTQGAPFQIFHFFFPRTLNRIFMCSQFTEHWSLCSGTLWTQRTQDAQFQILPFFSLNAEHYSYVLLVPWTLIALFRQSLNAVKARCFVKFGLSFFPECRTWFLCVHSSLNSSQLPEHCSLCAGSLWTHQTQAPFL